MGSSASFGTPSGLLFPHLFERNQSDRAVDEARRHAREVRRGFRRGIRQQVSGLDGLQP